jgi:multidrug efflux pump
MWLSDTSVKRPVFATVISLLLVSLGILSFWELPVREYPDITPAVVSVRTNYPGASAAVVETRITQVMESEISGISGVKSITSSSMDGQSRINIEFNLDRNIDDATNDVRDRVSMVQNRLPEDVELPRVMKQDSDARPILWMSLLDNTGRSHMDLTDYVDRYVVDRLETISGVSSIRTMGGGRPSMRIWIDRIALAARNLTVIDIENALQRENVELPAGRLDSKDKEFTARIARNYQTAKDFRQLVIRRGDDGHLIRLGEVAKVQVGPRDTRNIFRTNGLNTVGIGVTKQSTANTVDVLDAVKAEVRKINADLPDGMTLVYSSDESLFIREAIKSVYITIGITTALVTLVILLFLGSLRAMMIPALTIPICLVASFIILAAFGYSINLITLLALVLCIGLVVDDAIVVIENVHRRIETGEQPLLAAYNGTRQVAFAVIATTVVLVSVFAPIVFLKDNIGRIFSELAVTISAAVIFSSVLALSLAPMLCSKLMGPRGTESRGAQYIDRIFMKIADRYGRLLRGAIHYSWLVVCFIAVIALGAWQLFRMLPQEYAPREDTGTFYYNIQSSEGTGIARMKQLIKKVEAPLQPYVDSGVITRAFLMLPSFGGNANSALGGSSLSPWDQRDISMEEIIKKVNKEWSQIPELRIFAYMPSGLSRGRGGQPIQFVIGGTDYNELAKWRDRIMQRIENYPGLTRVDTDLKETQPQIVVHVDKDRAAELGVSVQSVGRTLSTLMSDQQITTYVVDGEEYDVVIEAKPEQRATPDDMTNIYVRSDSSGKLIPLANLTKVENIAGPGMLNRYNRLRSFTINADVADGYSMGDVLAHLEKTVKDALPQTARVDYKGESLEYKESTGKIYYTLGIALLVVFLVLAAQFESFIHPLIVMMTVPLAIAGVLIGLFVTGNTVNIYSQIGMIMLIGIAAKNGVLIVEFINQLRDQGVEFEEAIIEASAIRFRPVIMTTISTVMGSVPLMLASGAGEVSRTVLGIVLFFGVSFATVFTLFVVPVFYHLMAKHTGSPGTVARKLAALEAQVNGVTR